MIPKGNVNDSNRNVIIPITNSMIQQENNKTARGRNRNQRIENRDSVGIRISYRFLIEFQLKTNRKSRFPRNPHFLSISN